MDRICGLAFHSSREGTLEDDEEIQGVEEEALEER